jgi:hypothetical protein
LRLAALSLVIVGVFTRHVCCSLEKESTTLEVAHMTRTIGAAIGAVILFLFFAFGIAHPPVPSAPDVIASVRP